MNQSYFGQQPIPQTKITLVAAKCFEVPASNPVFYRPLQFQVSESIISRVVDITHGGQNIDARALSQVAPEIVSPSRQPQGELGIANGFGNQRIAVFLNFEVETAGRRYNEVLICYTDRSDFSMSGFINPETVLYVNSHLRLAESTIAIPEAYGNSRQAVANNDNVIRPIAVADASAGGVLNGAYTMRPHDLLAGWQVSMRPDNMVVNDPRGDILSQDVHCLGVASSRDNVSATRMMTKTLNGWNATIASNSGLGAGISGQEQETRWTIGNAMDTVREHDLSSVLLFSRLRERTTYSQHSFMSWHDLLSAMDAVNQAGIEPVIPLDPNAAALVNDTAKWNNAANTTNIAHKLSHGVPSIVSANLQTSFSFRAYGDVDTAQHFVSYQGSSMMFQGSPQTDQRLVNETIVALQNVIIPECVHLECNTYDIELDYTMAGFCLSRISINGGPVENFGLPNYCDSITAGNVAVDRSTVSNAGSQLGQLITGISDSSNVNPLYY